MSLPKPKPSIKTILVTKAVFKYFVLKIDTLVESTDIPKNVGLQYIARKSIISCISDFAAKGIKPIFGIVSVVLPRKLSKKKIEDLALGFGKASKESFIIMH